jgi:hypothetical protein
VSGEAIAAFKGMIDLIRLLEKPTLHFLRPKQ